MSDPLLSLRQVTYAYRSRRRTEAVLHGIDLDIEAGAFVSLVGPSGSGKTTLLNLMGLLERPTSGTIHFEGRDVGAMKDRARAALAREAIAFVFQAYHLLGDLTVADNVAEPLRYQKVPADERAARAADALKRFGLQDKAHRYPTELSGGQQQLVGVARAIAARPRLLLADEPTGNLHSSQGEVVMESLRTAHEDDGVTVVHVTHSDRWVAYGARTVELLDGHVLRDSVHHAS
ncbi:MAG: ABC transporter ATP-binding protein [Bacteroidota bacterium]